MDTGAVHAAFESSTRSGCGSENAPLVRWPGSETVSAASPAVLITVAVVAAVYSFATPGVNAPKRRRGAQSEAERRRHRAADAAARPATICVDGHVERAGRAEAAGVGRACSCTFVVPTANAEPDAGVHVTGSAPS